MILRILFIFLLAVNLYSCSKKEEIVYEPQKQVNPYSLYKEGMDAFEINDFFYASKKFSEAEIKFSNMDLAAKSAIMSAYSLYGINFYDEALDNLERYLKIYPADKNIVYAHFLIAVIYFEQISDEKKDLEPLIKAQEKINFFLKNYPNSDYATDLEFKKNFIENQLAAKELFIARYYMSLKKWVPAIKRLKNIVEKYENTIFIEEALHRLVEIYYKIGLEKESETYAKILGYNYNSSEWFEMSYKFFNKDYVIKKKSNQKKKEERDGIIEKIINKIK